MVWWRIIIMYHASPHLTYLLQTDLLKLNYPLYPPWDWAEKSFRCYSHSANPLLTGVPAEGFGHLIVSARLRMFQPEKRASVPAIWTHTSKKQKYGFKKPRFFLSEGPESWYKFCRILQQVSQILATSSDSRPHYSGRSGSCQNTSPRAERTCSFRKT